MNFAVGSSRFRWPRRRPKHLRQRPMRLLSERAINAEVLRGLDKLSPRYLDVLGHHLPSFLRPFRRLFVGVPGSLMYRELQRGGFRIGCIASPKIEWRVSVPGWFRAVIATLGPLWRLATG